MLTTSAHRVLIAGVLASAALTGLVWLADGRLQGVALLPDRGAAWYLWQLPEPTAWTRASAWLSYAAHQVAVWVLIWYTQRTVHRYTRGLHRVNLIALAVNLGFIGLHLAQTHVFYDGLAQDVSIFSSQGSVVLLLVVVLLMENRRRGMFFGRPAPVPAEVTRFLRGYHGYLFSWAAVYTFWYHPMVGTAGHLVGFFYMFLLLLQGSLFMTRAHTNRWWTLSLELVVVVHGALVAVVNSGPDGKWPMFLFGFLGVFVITQMHGLGLSRATRWLLAAGYVAAVFAVYAARGIGDVGQVVRIPAIDYVLVAVVAVLTWSGLRIARSVRRGKPVPADRAEAGAVTAGRPDESGTPPEPGVRR